MSINLLHNKLAQQFCTHHDCEHTDVHQFGTYWSPSTWYIITWPYNLVYNITVAILVSINLAQILLAQQSGTQQYCEHTDVHQIGTQLVQQSGTQQYCEHIDVHQFGT